LVDMVERLDVVDRRILYQLDLNSRQSLTQLGKKVRLKKHVVMYRIKRMQEDGIITGFWTQIDSYKLGYIVFRFYLVYQYMTPEVEQELIAFLVKDKRTWVVESIIGKYDLGVFVWVKNLRDFYQFWERLLDRFGDYFSEKIFSVYVLGLSYPCSYLLGEEFAQKDRETSEVTGGAEVCIDEFDVRLLNLLAVDARMSLVALAKELGCSTQMVANRMKRLRQQDVIQSYRVSYDLGMLGLKPFKVDVQLQEHSQRKEIIHYIQRHPHLVFIGTSAGVSDLELEFDFKDSDDIHRVMKEIKERFPQAVRKYDYFIVEQVHKMRFLPELNSPSEKRGKEEARRLEGYVAEGPGERSY